MQALIVQGVLVLLLAALVAVLWSQELRRRELYVRIRALPALLQVVSVEPYECNVPLGELAQVVANMNVRREAAMSRMACEPPVANPGTASSAPTIDEVAAQILGIERDMGIPGGE